MMATISNLVAALKSQFPDIPFYNGCINKNKNCVGVYARGNAAPPIALGGLCSYHILPVTILVHWSEDSNLCETTANTLYEWFSGNNLTTINNLRVIQAQLLDSSPVNIGRDDSNICEMTIRLNIFYERR